MINIMLGAIFGVASIMALAPTFQRIFSAMPSVQQLRALGYQGITDSRELRVTGNIQWIDLIADPPYRPWVHCFLINYGPAPVEVAINHPNDRFVMGAGETRTVDRTGADELIYSLFYVCPIGQTALLSPTGEY